MQLLCTLIAPCLLLAQSIHGDEPFTCSTDVQEIGRGFQANILKCLPPWPSDDSCSSGSLSGGIYHGAVDGVTEYGFDMDPIISKAVTYGVFATLNELSMKVTGYYKAPVTGTYTFTLSSDDEATGTRIGHFHESDCDCCDLRNFVRKAPLTKISTVLTSRRSISVDLEEGSYYPLNVMYSGSLHQHAGFHMTVNRPDNASEVDSLENIVQLLSSSNVFSASCTFCNFPEAGSGLSPSTGPVPGNVLSSHSSSVSETIFSGTSSAKSGSTLFVGSVSISDSALPQSPLLLKRAALPQLAAESISWNNSSNTSGSALSFTSQVASSTVSPSLVFSSLSSAVFSAPQPSSIAASSAAGSTVPPVAQSNISSAYSNAANPLSSPVASTFAAASSSSVFTSRTGDQPSGHSAVASSLGFSSSSDALVSSFGSSSVFQASSSAFSSDNDSVVTLSTSGLSSDRSPAVSLGSYSSSGASSFSGTGSSSLFRISTSFVPSGSSNSVLALKTSDISFTVTSASSSLPANSSSGSLPSADSSSAIFTSSQASLNGSSSSESSSYFRVSSNPVFSSNNSVLSRASQASETYTGVSPADGSSSLVSNSSGVSSASQTASIKLSSLGISVSPVSQSSASGLSYARNSPGISQTNSRWLVSSDGSPSFTLQADSSVSVNSLIASSDAGSSGALPLSQAASSGTPLASGSSGFSPTSQLSSSGAGSGSSSGVNLQISLSDLPSSRSSRWLSQASSSDYASAAGGSISPASKERSASASFGDSSAASSRAISNSTPSVGTSTVTPSSNASAVSSVSQTTIGVLSRSSLSASSRWQTNVSASLASITTSALQSLTASASLGRGAEVSSAVQPASSGKSSDGISRILSSRPSNAVSLGNSSAGSPPSLYTSLFSPPSEGSNVAPRASQVSIGRISSAITVTICSSLSHAGSDSVVPTLQASLSVIASIYSFSDTLNPSPATPSALQSASSISERALSTVGRTNSDQLTSPAFPSESNSTQSSIEPIPTLTSTAGPRYSVQEWPLSSNKASFSLSTPNSVSGSELSTTGSLSASLETSEAAHRSALSPPSTGNGIATDTLSATDAQDPSAPSKSPAQTSSEVRNIQSFKYHHSVSHTSAKEANTGPVSILSLATSSTGSPPARLTTSNQSTDTTEGGGTMLSISESGQSGRVSQPRLSQSLVTTLPMARYFSSGSQGARGNDPTKKPLFVTTTFEQSCKGNGPFITVAQATGHSKSPAHLTNDVSGVPSEVVARSANTKVTSLTEIPPSLEVGTSNTAFLMGTFDTLQHSSSAYSEIAAVSVRGSGSAIPVANKGRPKFFMGFGSIAVAVLALVF